MRSIDIHAHLTPQCLWRATYDLRYIQTSADETVQANWTVVDNV